MTGNINIPLNKLTQFSGNVRKTQDKGFIDKLAASIKAHDLQQNLVVKPDGKKFAVIAGGQRLLALRQLAEAGEIKSTFPVPCKIANGNLDPSEISLLENVLRDDMHPADEFDAFRDLIDKGVPVADIAARFGVSETIVMQRLKLARVSPAVIKAYRDQRLTLEQVMAFAVSDDHGAQEKVLENLRPHDRAASIREALTENEIAASDRRVKFVTVKAYEKAGGATRRDLFSTGEDSVFILDAALLDKLVTAKLARAAEAVGKEGWKWLEVLMDFGYDQKSQFQRTHAEPPPLSAKLAARVEKLEKNLETLREKWEEADDGSGEPASLGKIAKQLEEIEAGRGAPVWKPEQLAIAGTVVTIGHDGKALIERGLIRPDDVPKKKAKPKSGSTGADTAEKDEGEAPGLSSALIESLTAQRSAALAAELQQRPDIALAAVVHAFAARLLRRGLAADSSLAISVTGQSLKRVEGSKAFAHMEQASEKWDRALSHDDDALWSWCLEQKQSVLLDLLAFCAATAVNAVRLKGDRQDADRFGHADKLAAAVGLDMKTWFTPSAENYFSRVSKPQILEALLEAKQQPPAPAWEKLKKGELAQEAERQMAGKGWLPASLRPAA
jgi:ParB family transcriptional regulator, chromosome partitioning protein